MLPQQAVLYLLGTSGSTHRCGAPVLGAAVRAAHTSDKKGRHPKIPCAMFMALSRWDLSSMYRSASHVDVHQFEFVDAWTSKAINTPRRDQLINFTDEHNVRLTWTGPRRVNEKLRNRNISDKSGGPEHFSHFDSHCEVSGTHFWVIVVVPPFALVCWCSSVVGVIPVLHRRTQATATAEGTLTFSVTDVSVDLGSLGLSMDNWGCSAVNTIVSWFLNEKDEIQNGLHSALGSLAGEFDSLINQWSYQVPTAFMGLTSPLDLATLDLHFCDVEVAKEVDTGNGYLQAGVTGEVRDARSPSEVNV